MYKTRIKQIREKIGVSVAKFAKMLDMSASTITNYERGERTPSIEFLSQMSIKLGINLNWFVTGKGEMFITGKENQTAQYEDVKASILKEVKIMLRDEGLIK